MVYVYYLSRPLYESFTSSGLALLCSRPSFLYPEYYGHRVSSKILFKEMYLPPKDTKTPASTFRKTTVPKQFQSLKSDGITQRAKKWQQSVAECLPRLCQSRSPRSINWSGSQERCPGPHSSFNYFPMDSWQLGPHIFSFPNGLHAGHTCSKGLYPLLYNKQPIT